MRPRKTTTGKKKPGKMRIETTKNSARFIANGRTRFEVRARAGGGVEVIDEKCRYVIKPGDVRATTR